jgi:hypothetical protein
VRNAYSDVVIVQTSALDEKVPEATRR